MLEVIKRVLASFGKQAEAGLPCGAESVWEATVSGLTRFIGPLSLYFKVVGWIGRRQIGLYSVDDGRGFRMDVRYWPEFVTEGIDAARQKL